MQLEIFFPENEYIWSGFQPGPDWELMMDLQDKMWDKIPFTKTESQLWKEHQFAPKGFKYNTLGKLYPCVG
jgi:hypothetical protein